MYLVGLHIYYKMIHGPYNVKLMQVCSVVYPALEGCSRSVTGAGRYNCGLKEPPVYVVKEYVFGSTASILNLRRKVYVPLKNRTAVCNIQSASQYRNIRTQQHRHHPTHPPIPQAILPCRSLWYLVMGRSR